VDERSVSGLGTSGGGNLRLRPGDAVSSRSVTSPPLPLTLAVQVQQLQVPGTVRKYPWAWGLTTRLSEAIWLFTLVGKMTRPQSPGVQNTDPGTFTPICVCIHPSRLYRLE